MFVWKGDDEAVAPAGAANSAGEATDPPEFDTGFEPARVDEHKGVVHLLLENVCSFHRRCHSELSFAEHDGPGYWDEGGHGPLLGPVADDALGHLGRKIRNLFPDLNASRELLTRNLESDLESAELDDPKSGGVWTKPGTRVCSVVASTALTSQCNLNQIH